MANFCGLFAVALAAAFQVTCAHSHGGMKHLDHGVMLETTRPLNIAHRGASGTLPEHTLAGYREGIALGADVIECDVVLTKDLTPVCHHSVWLSGITDVANRPEFADRRKSVFVGSFYGNVTDDWFLMDFTLDEVKTLRVSQRYNFRDTSQDGLHTIPTLAEYIAEIQAETSRKVGIYPEVKVPAFHNALPMMGGQRMEDIVLDVLTDHGYTASNDPCFVQTFEMDSALYMVNKTSLPVVMLYDDPLWESLEPLGGKFYGIGIWKQILAPFNDAENGYKNWVNVTTSVVADAHAVGLRVHVYTFRNEDRYLAWDFKQDPMQEYKFFLDMGVDGLFTDFPETLGTYLDMRYPEPVTAQPCPNPTGSGHRHHGLSVAMAALVCFSLCLLVEF